MILTDELLQSYCNGCQSIWAEGTGKDKWSSAYDCRTILLSIQSLLGEPNNESPLNSSAAALWKNQEGSVAQTFFNTVVFTSLKWNVVVPNRSCSPALNL